MSTVGLFSFAAPPASKKSGFRTSGNVRTDADDAVSPNPLATKTMFDHYYDEIEKVIEPRVLGSHNRSVIDKSKALPKLASQIRRGLLTFGDVAPGLIRYLSDAAPYKSAWDTLERRGGHSPGPDNTRYSDFVGAHRWDVCRSLARKIGAGEYRTGPERVIQIRKSNGRGTRPIVLNSISDRVVHRAIAVTMRPFVEPGLDRHSFGFRTGRDRRHALATAEDFAFRESRSVLVTADIRDAFQNIRIGRLMDVVRMRFPEPAIVDLIASCLHRSSPTASSSRGLTQGGCLSPLLMNLYFDHLIDTPWRLQHPDVPLLRYVDDLLILAKTKEEASACYCDLQELLVSTGLSLKPSDSDNPVADLDGGAVVEWLGFSIRKNKSGMGVNLNEKTYDHLRANLQVAHESDSPGLTAVAVLRGWFSQLGPCFKTTKREITYANVTAICRHEGFAEIPDQTEAMAIWELAHKRWRTVRYKVIRAIEERLEAAE